MVLLTWGMMASAQMLPEKAAKPGKPPANKPAQALPPQRDPAPKQAPIGKRPAALEPEMVRIPEGEFRMGSANGRPDELPVRRVYISDFYVSKYAVTNAEYKRFIDATGHRAPASKLKGRPLWNGRTFPPQIARQPVVKVSWDDAVAYCRWLSRVTGKHYQLPTEAEWEKAARGGLDQTRYPWGDEPPDDRRAWFGKPWNGLFTLKDADYGSANGFGLYGMAGNVYQWVMDLYNARAYARSSERDPQGPFGGVDRVVRGGSVFDDASHMRCASRSFRPPSERADDVGFRIARK